MRLIIVILTLGTSLASTFPPHPDAAAATAVGAGRHEYCVVLISKQLDSFGHSKERGKFCTDKSIAAAKSGLDAMTNLSSTLLVVWYQHADYVGNQTGIYGDSGTCDSAGYRVEPNSYWKVNLSSILRAGNCDAARLTNIALTQSQVFAVSVPNIGLYNDNVGVMQVYDG